MTKLYCFEFLAVLLDKNRGEKDQMQTDSSLTREDQQSTVAQGNRFLLFYIFLFLFPWRTCLIGSETKSAPHLCQSHADMK